MKSSAPNNDSIIINSVDRSLDIILYMYEKAKPVRVTEIANDLGIYKSTVYRTLYTLANKGFLEKNEETDTYWFGLKLFAIGSLVGESFPINEIVAPYAKLLHDEVKEVVNVSVLDKTSFSVPKLVVIHKEESESQVLRANPSVGKFSDCHSSAAGKCLLAFDKNPLDINSEPFDLHQYTPHTIVDWDNFLIEIEKAKLNGYATDVNEREMELTCIGAPIVNRSGVAIASLSVAGPTQRMKENFEWKIKKVMDIAAMVSQKFK